MRAFFIILISLIRLTSFGQDTLTLTILFKSYSGDTLKGKFFDTLRISTEEPNKTYKTFSYDDLSTNNAIFNLKINKLFAGTYTLVFVTEKFLYHRRKYYAVICSKCENLLTVRLDTIIKGMEDFSVVQESPFAIYHYDKNIESFSPIEALRKDFFKGLKSREISKIKEQPFLIRAFNVGKYGLCDISIHPKTLNTKVRRIILKGFSSLHYWTNFGKEAEIRIDSKDLFTN